MNVHPAIAAFENDQRAQASSQKQFQKAVSKWEGQDQTRQIRCELESFGSGADLSTCPHLDVLFFDHRAASAFVQSWQRDMIAAMRLLPLCVPTFQYTAAPGLSNMVLMASGRAILSVIAYEEREESREPETAVFSDQETHECVLSGSGKGVLNEVRRCDDLDTVIDTCTSHWREGAMIVTKGPCAARQVVSVEGAMVLLQLSRKAQTPSPTREYSLTDGALLQTASGDKLASQKLLAMGVLGALEPAGALGAMRECALRTEEDADVRWEAVRQGLALDAAKGIIILEALAMRDGDPLQYPAQQLRQTLAESEPELAHRSGAAA